MFWVSLCGVCDYLVLISCLIVVLLDGVWYVVGTCAADYLHFVCGFVILRYELSGLLRLVWMVAWACFLRVVLVLVFCWAVELLLLVL